MARATLRMSFMGRDFEEEFLVIDNLTNTIMGIPFFAENDITIDCNTKRLHFANITAQLNEMMAVNGKSKKQHKKNTYSARTIEKQTIKPNEQTIIACRLDTGKEELPPGTLCGILDPSEAFEKRTDLCVTSALVKVDENGQIPVSLINVSGSEVKLNVKTMVGKLKNTLPKTNRISDND